MTVEIENAAGAILQIKSGNLIYSPADGNENLLIYPDGWVEELDADLPFSGMYVDTQLGEDLEIGNLKMRMASDE